MLTRNEAYKIVDTERDYQDKLGPDRAPFGNNPLHPSEELRLIRIIMEQADEDWYGLPGHANDTEYIRKIAGCAIRCIQNWGAPKR